MLKSSFIPIITAIPSKTKLTTCPKVLSNTRCTVRRNVSTKVSPHASYKFPPTSAYVHLPFCRKRCHYCDFPIIALGSSSFQLDKEPRIFNYIELLCREIKATNPSELESSCKTPLETVFFGGGTPSLVPPRQLSLILESLDSKFGIGPGAEISMEMDPGTFDCFKLKELMKLGVNRVSLGVQAFQEELLKACGRAHGLVEVHEAIEIVQSCGVKNWSLDLISSLPHQTAQMWEESLNSTIEAQPNHISVYDLQIEQGTKFGLLYTPGEFPLPSETRSAEFYKVASRMLTEAGYNHYEISSYCRSGYECKHNLTYWKNKPFYAFGLGSASYLNGVRFSRPKKLKEYFDYVKNLEKGAYSSEKSEMGDMDLAMDIIMLSLRTARGLDLKTFREAFGGQLVNSLIGLYKPYVESGHVICLDEWRRDITADKLGSMLSDESKRNEVLPAYIRLSDPEGFLLSNELISLAFDVMSA